MSLYSDHILPHVINLAMRNSELLPYRKRALSHAHGRVLEVGIGSGLNLSHYPLGVGEIVGLEPAPRLRAMAQRSAERSKVRVTLIEGSAKAMPLESESFDTIVTTWTLCSMADPISALREMRRVLKSGGQLVFVEHGLAPEERIQRWQNRLTPIWKVIGGGCHLNRPIRALIERGGFGIARLDTGYAKGPKPMTFFYEGCAHPT